MALDDEKECIWRIIFEHNEGGIYYDKSFLHAKRWDVCMSEKHLLINCGYYVEV